MLRIFKYDDSQNISLSPDKQLNILKYRTPSYVTIYRSRTLLRNGPVFLAHPVYFGTF